MWKLCQRLALTSAILSLSTSLVRAEVTDVGALFPPTTLAYAELHDPAAVSPELSAIVKGSVFEDSLKLVHERRDKTKHMRDLMAIDDFGILGLLTAPEAAGEFRKIRGAAVALTGFNDRNEPDVAFALLTGESQALGLAIRAYLTVNPQVRKIGVAGGVPVFQTRQAFIQHGPNGQPLPANEKPVEEGFAQPTFAYTPGLFVVGSNRAVVADVIARFQDSAKPSLASDSVFRSAVTKNRKPGVFWFALPKDLCNRLDAANKVQGDLIDNDTYAVLKMVANVKSVRFASGLLRFRDRGLDVAADLTLESGATSPLLALLEGQANNASTLKSLPGDTTLGFTIALPPKGRADAVLGFLDAIAKANGTLGRMPGQAAGEISTKFKIAIVELLARTRAITVALPTRQELPKGALLLPSLVFHTESAAAATQWADGIRAIVADLSGVAELPQPSTEMIDGVKVYSLPAMGLPWKAPVHYAVSETEFALGLDRKVVAASVKGGRIPPVPAGLDVKSAAAVGVFSPGRLLKMLLTTPQREAGTEGPQLIIEGPVPVMRPERRGPNGQPVDPELVKKEVQGFAGLMNSLETQPPAFGTVHRNPDEVRIAWFFPEVQGPAMAKVLDRTAAWLESMIAASGRDLNDRQGMIFKQ